MSSLSHFNFSPRERLFLWLIWFSTPITSSWGKPYNTSSGNPCQENSKDRTIYFSVRTTVQLNHCLPASQMLYLCCLMDWTQRRTWIFQPNHVELACVHTPLGWSDQTHFAQYLAKVSFKSKTMSSVLYPWDITTTTTIIILAFSAQCTQDKEGSWVKAPKSFIFLACCQGACQEWRTLGGRPAEILLMSYLGQKDAKLFQLMPTCLE